MNDTGTYDSSVMQSVRKFPSGLGKLKNRLKGRGRIYCLNESSMQELTDHINFKELNGSIKTAIKGDE